MRNSLKVATAIALTFSLVHADVAVAASAVGAGDIAQDKDDPAGGQAAQRPQGELRRPSSGLCAGIGILVGGGFLLATAWAYEKFTGVDGMGGGDIKLLAMIGAFLGWPSVPVTLFVASILGSVIGIGLMVATGAGRRLALPFAPFLCSGALAYLFYGSQLIGFYLGD